MEKPHPGKVVTSTWLYMPPIQVQMWYAVRQIGPDADFHYVQCMNFVPGIIQKKLGSRDKLELKLPGCGEMSMLNVYQKATAHIMYVLSLYKITKVILCGPYQDIRIP